MLLEVRTASRKTPGDGRFEISAATAARLTAIGAQLEVEFNDATSEVTIAHMQCSCAKAEVTGAHEHHFLVSDLFRAMEPGRWYAAELAGPRLLRLSGAHDGLR